MNPVQLERLVAIAHVAAKAGHGGKEAVYQAACEELQMSRSTLLRKIGEVTLKDPRKKRDDAGETTLTREDALTLSAALMETIRGTDKTKKRIKSIEKAVNELRANGLIEAGRTDEVTGEFFPLSVSAISRALRRYRLHPDQLSAPAPAVQLASQHPNHVWELDASICVLYYLKNPDKHLRGGTGLARMSVEEFNKNKPKNFDRVVRDRVWSFELTDHTSGWVYVEYLFGGETSQNFTSVLINAMQDRGGADVLHGVPKILFTDPGSALTAPTLRNLCKALGIRMIAHKARNARATGSVEKARDIIERDFESGLRFVRVEDINELNRLARLWRMNYNRMAVHSRHAMTRTDCWLKYITGTTLVKAPDVVTCQSVAVDAPESRKVTTYLQVPFRGKDYDVSSVPGVCVGDSIQITRNPWREDVAQVFITGEDGLDTFYCVDEVVRDVFGYTLNAPVIGESYRTLPQTEAQNNQAEIEQHITETHSVIEAQAARKAKALPFGGRFNPYMEMEQVEHPEYLPKRGQESQVRAPRMEERPLTHVEAAKQLRERFTAQGLEWHKHYYSQIVERFPDGVPAEELDILASDLQAKQQRGGFRVVNGQ